jgi:hypothetical protein
MSNVTPQNEYDWWRAALSGNVGPLHDGEPQSGRYRSRRKNKETGEIVWRPVAYWNDWSDPAAPRMLCKIGDKMLDAKQGAELWSYVAQHPITNEVYKHAMATGEWPDVHPAAQRDRINSANAPDPDSLEAVKDSVEDLAREAEKLIKAGAAKTKDESDRAADLADRLRKLEVRADTRRRQLNEPHEDEIDKINGAWNPVRDLAADAKQRLKAVVVTPFLLARDAAEAKAREDAAKTGAPVAAPPPRKRAAGTSSRVSLTSQKSAVIKDYDKALAYFAQNQKVKDLIQQLANAAVRSGTTPDGCELHENKVAA